MTKQQERRIEEIREIMLNLVGYRETKEIKEEKIEELFYGAVSMVIEVGNIGDEGTMAELYCRDRAHVFIGPRGGCFTYAKAKSGANKGQLVRYEDNVRGVIWRSVLDK